MADIERRDANHREAVKGDAFDDLSLKPLPMPEAHERGFLLPTLLRTDTKLYGRWDYLALCWEKGELPDAPLPRMDFLSVADKAVMKMLTSALDSIPNHYSGAWRGWSGTEYFRYFLEWILYGLHHQGQPEPPKEPVGCAGAGERLKETLDLALWQSSPYDYLGDLLAENAYGKRQGFFPTPHTVCEMMARITFPVEGDARRLTVCDPCVGTGRLLVHASNYSMRLYGMDIDPLLCLATLVNGYLYAPWLVKPLPYLDAVQYEPEASVIVSDSIASQAPPHIAATLENTEHDADEQWRFQPIKKRRNNSADGEIQQGTLFSSGDPFRLDP